MFEVDPSVEGRVWQQRLKSCLNHLFKLGQLFNDEFDYSSCAMLFNSGSRMSMENAVPLWVYVYYALSAGQLPAAIDELRKCADHGTSVADRAACVVLEYFYKLSTAQRSGSTAAHQILSKDELREFDRAIAQCRDSYNESESDGDPYRSFVLNLLSLSNRNELSNPDIPTYLVEDYLWSCLWFTYYNRLLVLCLDSNSHISDLKLYQINNRAMDGYVS